MRLMKPQVRENPKSQLVTPFEYSPVRIRDSCLAVTFSSVPWVDLLTELARTTPDELKLPKERDERLGNNLSVPCLLPAPGDQSLS